MKGFNYNYNYNQFSIDMDTKLITNPQVSQNDQITVQYGTHGIIDHGNTL